MSRFTIEDFATLGVACTKGTRRVTVYENGTVYIEDDKGWGEISEYVFKAEGMSLKEICVEIDTVVT